MNLFEQTKNCKVNNTILINNTLCKCVIADIFCVDCIFKKEHFYCYKEICCCSYQRPDNQSVKFVPINAMEKEMKIIPPEGYEIDKENSTFECIKFKKKEPERWIDQKYRKVDGYYIDLDSTLRHVNRLLHKTDDRNVFATEKQAKSALAFAQLTQILANDKRFDSISKIHDDSSDTSYTILYNRSTEEFIYTSHNSYYYGSISFKEEEQAKLFIKENEDLLRQYFMID